MSKLQIFFLVLGQLTAGLAAIGFLLTLLVLSIKAWDKYYELWKNWRNNYTIDAERDRIASLAECWGDEELARRIRDNHHRKYPGSRQHWNTRRSWEQEQAALEALNDVLDDLERE